MQASEILDLVKTMSGLTSDYQVHQKFNVTRSAVSKWRRNLNFPNNELLVEFAEITEINAGLLMLYGLQFNEKNPKAKHQIERLINAIHHARFDDSYLGEAV